MCWFGESESPFQIQIQISKTVSAGTAKRSNLIVHKSVAMMVDDVNGAMLVLMSSMLILMCEFCLYHIMTVTSDDDDGDGDDDGVVVHRACNERVAGLLFGSIESQTNDANCDSPSPCASHHVAGPWTHPDTSARQRRAKLHKARRAINSINTYLELAVWN